MAKVSRAPPKQQMRMPMLDRIYIPQNLPNGEMNPEWLTNRVGKLGASLFPKICKDGKKKGEPSAMMITEAMKLAAEQRCNSAWSRVNPENEDIKRGLELEPEALAEYEIHTDRMLSRGPHWTNHPKIVDAGATPDSWVAGGGLVQVKCPRPENYFATVVKGQIPKDVELQMLWECAVTGEPWNDYVAYCPYMPEGDRIWVKRYEPTVEQIEWAEGKAKDFLDRVHEYLTGFKNTFKKEAA